MNGGSHEALRITAWCSGNCVAIYDEYRIDLNLFCGNKTKICMRYGLRRIHSTLIIEYFHQNTHYSSNKVSHGESTFNIRLNAHKFREIQIEGYFRTFTISR